MNKLKRTFELLYSKFSSRKSFFQKKVDTWKERGKRTLHETGKGLLDTLEKEGEELKALFADAATSVEKAAVRSRIKVFKKAYKKLHEATKPAWRQWLEALIIAGAVALVLRSFIFGLYHVPTGSAEPTILVGDRVWGNKLAYMFGKKVKRGELVIFDNPEHKYESNKLKYIWQRYIGLPIPLLGVSAGPINMVKRVIAVPGDWIEGRIEKGKPVIYLNGKKLDEPYVNPYPLIWLRKETGFLPIKALGSIPLLTFLQKRPVEGGFWCTYDPDKSFEEQSYYNMTRDEVIVIPGYSSLRKAFTPSPRGFMGGESADVFGPMRVPKGKYWVMGDSRKNSRDARWFGFLDESLIHGRLSFIIYSIDSQEPLWLFELLKHPIDFWRKAIRWNRFFKAPRSVNQIESKEE